jgi:[acyl-carrier-protein] S-malonyltransferase
MMERNLVFVFPGQSSRDPDMFDRLACVNTDIGKTALTAFEAKLGRQFDGAFVSNREIQLAVFEVSQAWFSLVRGVGLNPHASAGLSLGEYSHLVAINALTVDAARNLVAARGLCYDAGPTGVMAAVFPLLLEELEELCVQVRSELLDEKSVAVANINSPSQNVIAGTMSAVDRVLALAEEKHYVTGQIIEQRMPMHVRLFAPASMMYRPALEAAPWQEPTSAYWPNVEAKIIKAAKPTDFVDSLTRHVWQPVLWRATIDAMEQQYQEPVYVEVGPSQVLARMMCRKWINPKRVFAVDALDKTSASVFNQRIEEIQHALAH